MSLFDAMLLDVVLILFPLNVCLLYQTYKRSIDNPENDIYLDLALISMLYLLLRFGIFEYKYITYFIVNIPLVIAFLKGREVIFILISIILITYYYYLNPSTLLMLIIGYSLCYIVFKTCKKLKQFSIFHINIFLVVVSLTTFLYLYDSNILVGDSFDDLSKTIVIFMIFYSLTFMIIYLFQKSEDILIYNNSVKQLEEEKQLRISLFKITHEIKNPIAVCKGYLDMFDVNNKSHSEKYVPIIKQEISKVLNLLQDFLSITKIKVEKDIIDINYLLEESMASIMPLLKEHKIEGILELDDDEQFIEADYNRINQVIINLVKNSIEALNDTIEKQIKISTKKLTNSIEIVVEDNGTGITKENLQNMKEPFFTTKKNGTGLGVYLSREIIKAHGGKINYKNKEDMGTKVTITLPMKKDINFA